MQFRRTLWFFTFILSLVAIQLRAALVINEIHYNPDVKTEPVEFVELYNTGDAAVNLSGWQLAGGVRYVFPNGTWIAGGGYLVVAQNPPSLAAKFNVTALGPWSGLLNNDGDQVILLNAAGAVENEVEYQLGFPWPTVGDPPGYSIELVNPAFDNTLGGNWRASVVGTPAQQTLTLIADHSVWSFRRGTNEASFPTTAWRELNFDDSQWETGPAPVGYEPANGLPMGSFLSDMSGNYICFFMRKKFVVEDPQAIATLRVQACYDDGFKLWINGTNVLNQGLPTNEVPYTASALGSARESNAYDEFQISNPSKLLKPGTNIIAVQVHNINLANSSDAFFDCRLLAGLGSSGVGPTPGVRNAVYATNVPPQIRQVDHSPEQPRSGQSVVVTAKVTDPDGVSSVSLKYQVVEPGNYFGLGDAAYTNNWTSVPMNDSGQDGDAYAGDSIYTAVLPATVQHHRNLVRYRISATDSTGATVTVPYPDDPQPNFAYFVYDGVPAWSAAVRPGTTPLINFDTNVMNHLSAVHLISRFASVSNATWGYKYGGDLYLWNGTLVYDGKVYDHIRYRARGGVWRYAMVKNMWKFDLNRGHDLQMRDDYGRKYRARWTKLNLGASIQQGDYWHRGEQGMFESVGFRLFNLAGVPACRTTFLQFRIIDNAVETDPNTQYEGDFWGVYLAVEQEDGRYLDEHDLLDGNFYKMDTGAYPYPGGDLNNQGPTGVSDKSDLTAFVSGLNSSSPVEWWQTNWVISNGCSYQAIVQAIHHYDIGAGKNYFYYLNPQTRIWIVNPWDLDLTWADNMYDAGGQGAEPFKAYAIPKPAIGLQYKNRVREIRDLLFNTDQAYKLIDEYARLLRGTNTGPNILDADRCMWDYNPKMAGGYSSAQQKAGQGLFYQWPESVSKTFDGCIQLMKNYVGTRGSLLDSLAADSSIPAPPAITYTGPADHAMNRLSFTCSAYSGSNPFASLRWRVGEVTDPAAPTYAPAAPVAYEITSVWESDGGSSITLPVSAFKVGHAYRVRARMQDTTGRWSRWSAPIQFVAGLPDNAGALLQYLQITELMYQPAGDSDYEFVELHNAGSSLTLNLEGANFTDGIDFTFPAVSLPPDGYAVVIKTTNQPAFRQHYGLDNSVLLVGPYSGSLANGGEQLTLKTVAGGSEIFAFKYGGRGWPVAGNGAGHSLIPLASASTGQATGALDYPGNWRASSFIAGSPGRADPPTPAPTVVLNEITAHTDYYDPARPEYDSNDWLELYNTTSTNIPLAGWYLSDDPQVPNKWPIPATATVPPRGWLRFDEVSGFHNPITNGFGIDKAGEQILLSYLPGNGADRVVDAVAFKGQDNGQSLGRYPDGAPYWFTTLRTSNTVNTPLPAGMLLTEIMYHPPDFGLLDNTRDEFIELYNASSGAISLQDTNGAWRIDGGIGFTFPAGTIVPAGKTLLVVNIDPADPAALATFRSVYSITDSSVQILGPYSGKLSNRSDRVALERPQYPDLPGEPYSWIIVDEVIYGNQDPWSSQANGASNSLHRISVSRSGNEPANWFAATPDPGLFGSLDSDSDGMPDAWETEYSLDPNNPADAAEDADGDHLTNLQEYLAGTDPRDPLSCLQFDSVTFSTNGLTLRFTARAGKTYSIQFRVSANEGAWINLTNTSPAPATAPLEIVDPSVGGTTRFYRLVTPAMP